MASGLHARDLASERPAAGRRLRVRAWWYALGGILAVQAALSVRLVWSNTAFTDEALYLWAGHLEWAHWLHGAPVPVFATYFSGAPVLYPPLGALADSAGGLAGARLLSLCFMLGATCLLWAVTSRLRGRRAAFFAASLWVALGPTQFLGAFATFDAMALFLLTLAAWSVVRAAQGDDQAAWMIAGIAALVLANMTKYASALFDPVVAAAAVLAPWPRLGARRSLRQAAIFAGYVVVALAGILLLGGYDYAKGVAQTTLARAPGDAAPGTVASLAWEWTRTVVAVAAAGTVLAWLSERRRSRAALLTVFAAAALLAPLEEARLHTTVSLHKHVDFGAWFAAVAAGYAVDWLISRAGSRALQAGAATVGAAVLAVPLSLGAAQAAALQHSWPDSQRFVAVFGRLTANRDGPILMDDPSIGEYYSPAGAQWWRWSSTGSLRYAGHRVMAAPVGGFLPASAFSPLIARGYFATIAVTPSDTSGLGRQITADLRSDREYQLAVRVPYGRSSYDIWTYRSTGHAAGSPDDYVAHTEPPSPEFLSILSLEGRMVAVCTVLMALFCGLVRVAWRHRKRIGDL
jgi:hypothetical protein